eukprot:753401-Hanusia_phi.AAC.2
MLDVTALSCHERLVPCDHSGCICLILSGQVCVEDEDVRAGAGAGAPAPAGHSALIVSSSCTVRAEDIAMLALSISSGHAVDTGLLRKLSVPPTLVGMGGGGEVVVVPLRTLLWAMSSSEEVVRNLRKIAMRRMREVAMCGRTEGALKHVAEEEWRRKELMARRRKMEMRVAAVEEANAMWKRRRDGGGGGGGEGGGSGGGGDGGCDSGGRGGVQ